MVSQYPPGNCKKQDLKQTKQYGYKINKWVGLFCGCENSDDIDFEKVNVSEKANEPQYWKNHHFPRKLRFGKLHLAFAPEVNGEMWSYNYILCLNSRLYFLESKHALVQSSKN
jgi:hypothetical protein